ncbi:major facilitator superfamily nitrite extrusion protein [Salmonella enterica subsp. enterica]|uniref:Major facilitator superfamily nitrite extrusion protein n=1 Tax=Salmonella enterica I TaxID=59201 RepID=A0A447U201_SALET|nr:major facilitator superfamily nitrite extrusion protein [Salmonella enterica subsp. enterica]
MRFSVRLSARWRVRQAAQFSDRLGGTRVTLINFVLMAIFSGLLFLTLPTGGVWR